jgi:hypothetical protein
MKYNEPNIKEILSLISFISTPELLSLLNSSNKKDSDSVHSFAPKFLILKAISKLNVLNDNLSFFDLRDYLAENDLKEYFTSREVEDNLVGYMKTMESEGLLSQMQLTNLSKEILNKKKEIEHLFSNYIDVVN